MLQLQLEVSIVWHPAGFCQCYCVYWTMGDCLKFAEIFVPFVSILMIQGHFPERQAQSNSSSPMLVFAQAGR